MGRTRRPLVPFPQCSSPHCGTHVLPSGRIAPPNVRTPANPSTLSLSPASRTFDARVATPHPLPRYTSLCHLCIPPAPSTHRFLTGLVQSYPPLPPPPPTHTPLPPLPPTHTHRSPPAAPRPPTPQAALTAPAWTPPPPAWWPTGASTRAPATACTTPPGTATISSCCRSPDGW